MFPILEYMQSQWICSDTTNWYKGFMPRYISTNNELDRANKTLKDDYTLCVELGIAELDKMEEAVTSWSLNEDCDSFKDHKTYCLRDWTGCFAVARCKCEGCREIYSATQTAAATSELLAVFAESIQS